MDGMDDPEVSFFNYNGGNSFTNGDCKGDCQADRSGGSDLSREPQEPNIRQKQEQEQEEQQDWREENAQLYERPNRSTARATDAQINYVRILLRDGFLDRDDFRSSLEFFRKKTTLTMERANCLIKLGKKRMREYKARQREAQERWG